MCKLLGDQWLPVRRFCVEQKGKLRPIDDFCESRLNQAFSSVDKISLKTMDHVTWAALVISKYSLHNHEMDFVLKSGERLHGTVHSDWIGGCSINATTLDLRSAYKQLPLHEADVAKAVVTLRDPACKKTKHFTMCTLPFGASASVLHFNRISTLLWALGCHLNIIWSSYFDDYPVLCPEGLERSSLGAAKAMLGLLGFEYSSEKLKEPGPKSEMLGVELDLTESKTGCIAICNKRDRVDEISAALDKIVSEGRLRPRDLQSHLGRLQFAEMQIAGRAGRLAMADLRQMGSTEGSLVDLNDSQINALSILKARITSGKPKRLIARPSEKPWLLFTDGALEYDEDSQSLATVGAVLISPAGVAHCFGVEVPHEVVKLWKVDGREHVIGLVELYACVVALNEWKEAIAGQRVLLFIDNYGAQDCLVKGSASINT